MLPSALYTSLSGMQTASAGINMVANRVAGMSTNYTNPYQTPPQGVDLATESVNLIQFQTTYKVNAKMISVEQNLFQTTLDMLG